MLRTAFLRVPTSTYVCLHLYVWPPLKIAIGGYLVNIHICNIRCINFNFPLKEKNLLYLHKLYDLHLVNWLHRLYLFLWPTLSFQTTFPSLNVFLSLYTTSTSIQKSCPYSYREYLILREFWKRGKTLGNGSMTSFEGIFWRCWTGQILPLSVLQFTPFYPLKKQ